MNSANSKKIKSHTFHFWKKARNLFVISRSRVQVPPTAHGFVILESGVTFISAVSPEISVIEVGAGNSYEHPHIEILEKLPEGSTVYRTGLKKYKYEYSISNLIIK
jgi:hypothetical protein